MSFYNNYVPREQAEYTLLLMSGGIPVIDTLFWNHAPWPYGVTCPTATTPRTTLR